ncbi:MAG: flippase-like domain-containing protein [Chloroflexi bacterium]|nr:flippase-like domain-containing protein [Chloroflexota bacterium]
MTVSRPTVSQGKHLPLLIRAGVGVLLGAAAVWWLLHAVDWRDTLVYLSGASKPGLAAGLLLCAAGSFAGAVRWKLLLHGQGVSARRLYVVQNTGLGADTLSPLRILSIPVQLFMLGERDRVPFATAFGSLSAKRLMDVLVNSALLLAGFLTVRSLWPALLVVLPAMGWNILAWTGIVFMGRLGFGGRGARMAGPAGVVGKRSGASARLGLATLLTFMSWVCIGLGAWAASQSMGAPLPIVAGVSIGVAGMVIAGALPGLPAALGTFELTFVYLAGMVGIGPAQALAAALCFHAMIIAPAVAVAVIALPKEVKSPAQIMAAYRRVASEVKGQLRPSLSAAHGSRLPED